MTQIRTLFLAFAMKKFRDKKYKYRTSHILYFNYRQLFTIIYYNLLIVNVKTYIRKIKLRK